ncbi:cytochrome C oxidase subunit IV family protein [Candidatus Sumerlaeota bacterium]|nr:cytochrome C oxidase subunit IV family protein [Candidatus Sumerlaeota bacterium]
MSGDAHHSHDDDKHHVQLYKKIGATLGVCTVLTVAVGLFHIPYVPLAVLIALVIACFKGSLVAAYFMHLKGEKAVIWWSLLLTVIFWVVLMAVPVLTTSNNAGEKVSPRVTMRDSEGGEHGKEGAKHEGGAAETEKPAADPSAETSAESH